jgi:hypothetical protein
MSHAFQVGDRVHYNPRTAPQSTVESFLQVVTIIDTHESNRSWVVERLLPPAQGGYQYHIRCAQDGALRLVSEAQLKPLLEPSS